MYMAVQLNQNYTIIFGFSQLENNIHMYAAVNFLCLNTITITVV